MRLNAVNKYIFFIISSVVLQSIAYGFLSKDSYNFILFIVLQGFFLTSLFYFLIGLNKGFELKFSDVMPLLKLNISTALAFLCFYISLYFIPASISSLVEASAGPLWGVVIGLLYSNEKVSLKTLFNTVMIFLCSMVILFIDRVDGISKKDVVGVILSILAALGATLIAFGSKSSSKNTLPIISVLAFRFNLTWMISFVYLKYTHYDFFLNFKVEYIFLAFFGITLPMYFLQLGMRNVHPVVTMICLSFIPVVTYMCEFILGGGFNYTVFLLLLFSVALALLQLKSSKC